MKLTDILSERYNSPTKYAYHATKGEYLRSILKQGLVPNKNKGGYGSEAKSDAGYKQKALSGVYFTYEVRDVEDIAKAIGERPFIIVAKLQPRSTQADEDNLNYRLFDEWTLVQNIKQARQRGGFNAEQMAEEETHKAMSQAATMSDDTRLKANLEPLIYDYSLKLINYIIKKDKHKLNAVRAAKDKLSKAVRNSGDKLFGFKSEKRIRLNEPVSFSGANKIVGIYDFDNRTGWGDLGSFEHQAYHKYKSPQELLKS